MAISVEWDNEDHTALRYDFDSEWSWDDLHAAIQADDRLMASVNHRVHLIFDMHKTQMVPPDPMAHLHDLFQEIGPKMGLLILCGATHWAETIADIFYRYFERHLDHLAGVRFVDTLDEARALVKGERPAGNY